MAGKMGQGLFPMKHLGGEPLQPGRVNNETMEGKVFELADPVPDSNNGSDKIEEAV